MSRNDWGWGSTDTLRQALPSGSSPGPRSPSRRSVWLPRHTYSVPSESYLLGSGISGDEGQSTLTLGWGVGWGRMVRGGREEQRGIMTLSQACPGGIVSLGEVRGEGHCVSKLKNLSVHPLCISQHGDRSAGGGQSWGVGLLRDTCTPPQF